MSRYRKVTAVCLAAMLSLGLTACGGGGGGGGGTEPPIMPELEPVPTPAEQLAAAKMVVTLAEAAVAAATTDAERAAAYQQLATARAALAAAEALPENIVTAQHNAVAMAISTAQGLVDALTATSTQAEVDAANTAITGAGTALAGAVALSSEQMSTLGGQISGLTVTVTANDVLRDRHTVKTAVAAAKTAVDELSATPSETEVQVANAAVTTAEEALAAASNLPEHEANAYQLALGGLDAQIMTASSTGTELAAAQRISNLYSAIEMQRNAAGQAVKDAAAAAKQATDNVDKRSSAEVNGESMTAQENSQMVLDGGRDASAAVTAAEVAKTALEALDTEGIAAAYKATLDEAIENAVEYVDAQIETAEASETDCQGATSRRSRASDEEKPNTPAADALAVAMNINTALGPNTALGTATGTPERR